MKRLITSSNLPFQWRLFPILAFLSLISLESQSQILTCNAHFIHQVAPSVNGVSFVGGQNPTGTVYNWNFGDGTTGNGPNIVHTYQPGNYWACLTVIVPSSANTTACTATFCDSIHVGNTTVNCNSNFTFQHTNSGVHFTSANNPSNTTYLWSFGDGHHSSIANPTHVYTPGNYQVCLTVTIASANGSLLCTSTHCDSIHIAPTTNNCNAHFTKQPAPVVNSIYFVSPPNPPGATYSWNFGDGGTSTNANVVHHYLPGNYLACLTITVPATTPNTLPCISTYCDSIHISQNINCNAHFTHTAASGVNGVYFTSQGNPAGTQYNWNFGDGGTANIPNPVHNFSPGNYQVCLTVTLFSTNSNLPLCTATFCDSIHIGNVGNCIANFQYQHLSTPLTYAFTNLSSPNSTGFFWHFGDATTSTAANPFHHYTNAGPKQVCLTMFDTIHHCSNTKCIMLPVSAIVANPIGMARDEGDNSFDTATDELKVNIYPNPTADNATVHIENAKTPVTFTMYDNTGKIIENKSKLTNGDFEIDNSNRAAGIYFYRIISEDNSTLNGKLIIQK